MISVLDWLRLVELTGEPLADPLPQDLFQEPGGVLAGGAAETFGLKGGSAFRADYDLDLLHAVNLIEPSGRAVSVTVCPRLRASIRHFSAA